LKDTPSTDLLFKGFKKDYMTAQSEEKSLDKVTLNFSHLQAKLNIRIKLAESMTTAQDIKVTDIRVHNLNDKGYYTNAKDEEGKEVGVSGWTVGTATADYVPCVTTDYLINNADEEEGIVSYHNHYVLEQLIIPQTITKYKATTTESTPVSLSEYDEACVYVEYTIGAETFKSYTPLANIFTTDDTYSFEGGNQYTLNITVGPKPIEFTAVVTPWVNGNESNLPMD
jgi:hypothetical protein